MAEMKNWLRFFINKNYRTILYCFLIVALGSLIFYRYLAENKSGDSSLTATKPAEKAESKEVDTKYSQFGLVIPKLKLDLPVIADVDGTREDIYQKQLKNGVAHYLGTAKPSEKGNVFIFGHSSDYPQENNPYAKAFLDLPQLEEGDEVKLWYQDKQYDYSVIQSLIVEPTETSWLDIGSENYLTLMTCYPADSKQRYIVRAKRSD